jgi:transposase-like protein
VPGLAGLTDEPLAEHAADVAQLYMEGYLRSEICAALNLTKTQVANIIHELLMEGMPKRQMQIISDQEVRALHAAYVLGGVSIGRRARAIGVTGSTVRRRMRKLKLAVERQKAPRCPARTPAQAEQRVITALLMANVDELRKPQGLSLERLAHASDISMWTLQRMRGRLSDPPLTTVLRLFRGLGVTPGEPLNAMPLPIEPRARRPRESRKPAT